MLPRRKLLQLLVATAAAGGSLTSVTSSAAPESAAQSGKRRIGWRNWSGLQQCQPAVRAAPASLGELQELVANSTGTIRPVGSGHSFTALVPTDDTIVSLARMAGMTAHDPDTLQATFHAGTQLSQMGEQLHEVGQALINMPDIDEQVLAGALATSTHGTGAGIGGMPTFVEGLQLVTADGSLVECSATENPELFQAARVSLGALGVITQVKMQNIAPYNSRRESWFLGWEEMLETAEGLADSNRNFEFYYIPFSGQCLMDTHNLTEEAVYSTPKADQNAGMDQLKMARDYLSWSNTLRGLPIRALAATMEREVTVEASWLNYASERNVRFNEMEYHLPRENGLKALREVREVLERDHPEVFFPIEVRYIKGDDIWLSPFFQRDSVSIAVHRYFEEDHRPYFSSIEPVFRKHGGRPHWGKLNTLKAADFALLYPHWNDFLAVREQVDPAGKFLNPYLRQVFGLA
jgi:FAD-linked oxidoreductase